MKWLQDLGQRFSRAWNAFFASADGAEEADESDLAYFQAMLNGKLRTVQVVRPAYPGLLVQSRDDCYLAVGIICEEQVAERDRKRFRAALERHLLEQDQAVATTDEPPGTGLHSS